MATQVASLFAVLSLKDEATAKLSGFKSSLLGSEGAISKLGKSVSGVGMSLVKTFGPASAIIAGTVYKAIEFDKAMTNVGAVLGKNRDEMATLNQQVLDIGTNSIAGPQAAAEAFYDIVGGVADASTHMAILNASIATAEAGNAELGGTTNALISIMNTYGFSANKAAFVSDVLTTTVAKGVGTMDEFAGALPGPATLAKNLGIAVEDVAWQLAFLTTKGYSASESATKLTASYTAFMNPNRALKDAITELGYATGTEMVQSLGSVDAAFAALTETSVYLNAGGFGPLLGSVEATQAALVLAGGDASTFGNTFKTSIDGATEASRALQLESPAAQMALLKSQVAGLSIQLGQVFLPILLNIVNFIKPVVKGMIDWVKQNPKLATAIGAVVVGLTVLGAVLVPLGMAISAFGVVMGVVFSPIVLIIGALVAAGALLYLAWKNNFLGIQDTTKKAFGTVKGIFDKISKLVTSLVKDLKSGKSFSKIFQDMLHIDPRLATYLAFPLNLIKNMFGGFYDAIKKLLSGDIGGAIKSFINTIINNFKLFGEAFTNLYSYIFDAVGGIDWGGIATKVWEGIKSAFGAVVDFGAEALTWINDKLLQPLITAVTGADWGKIASDVWGYVNTGFTLAVGAIFNAAAWIKTNILSPLALAVLSIDWSNIPAGIWAGIKSGFATAANAVWNAFSWINTNIIEPIKDAITKLLPTIVDALNDIFPDAIHLSWPSVRLWGDQKVGGKTIIPGASIPGGNFTLDLPDNPIPGGSHQTGTPWTGTGPLDKVAGVVHYGEAVVPNSGMSVRPSPAGLLLEGASRGGGGITITGDIYVSGVQNPTAMYEAILKEAKRRKNIPGNVAIA